MAENKNAATQDVLDLRHRRHLRRSGRARQGLVLRQLPLPEPRGRRHDARHERVHAHGGQHAEPGLRQGQLGADHATTRSSFTFLNDPTDITGRRERDITNARDRAREQGGNRYSGNYTRVWGATLLEVGANKHNGEVSDLSAIRESSQHVSSERPTSAR